MNWTGGNGQKGFGRGTRAQIHTLSAHAVKQKSKLRRAFKPGKPATTLFETLSRSRQCQRGGTGSKDVAVLRMPVFVEERPAVHKFERDEMEYQVDEASRRSSSPAPSDHRYCSPILSAEYPILRPDTAVSFSAQEETLSNVDSGAMTTSTSHNSRVHQTKQLTYKEARNKLRPAISHIESSASAESLATTAEQNAQIESNESNVRRETDWKKLLWPTHAASESIVSFIADESSVRKRGNEEPARSRTPRLEQNTQDWASRISALESRVKRLEHKVCM
ncbi:hypothetical protein HDU77_009025 [Chytriomyces hyalinus]|nr:hypothetical protein HDU77_009025 [Chytriomyces hyalinus]